MTKEDRVLRLINKQDVDYLPSQIVFADRTRDEEISAALGLSSPKELDDYLENHLYIAYSLYDKPQHYQNDKEKMKELEQMGYVGVDEENGVLYDGWGMGIKLNSDGFYACYHPLQGKDNSKAEKFMPPHFNKEVLYQDIEDAVKNYRVPDPYKEHNFCDIEAALKKYSGNLLVLPSGYWGIFERAYGLMGFQEFMTEIALNPKLIEELLDKITDHKVEEAKIKIKLGAKIGHHGDDLATQQMTFFSKSMFRRIIKPRLARLFSVYKDAGIPVAMHSCGNITDFIPDLIEIGLDVLEPVQPCMDLKKLKREFGKDLTFWGGIDTQELLPYGTPEKVRTVTRETIRTLGAGGGLIIAPSQEIMSDVPLENIVALVETIKEEREIALNM